MSFNEKTAFSLIELLIVVAILMVAAGFLAPAYNQILGGSDLGSASDLLAGQLTQARQMAITRNRNIEVRLYRYAKGGEERYRAFQTFLATEDPESPWRPMGRMQVLPQRACIDSGATLSPLIAGSSALDGQQTKPAVNLPGISTYKYVKILFRPDGSCLMDEPGKNSFFTVKESRLEDPSSQLPANYSLIRLFSSTGAVRVYRP